jgi:hypothetical protein
MNLSITILTGERPPPSMTLVVPDSLDKSIEEAIPDDLKPGYVSKSNAWGLVWVVKDARCYEKVREKPKKKRKKDK